MFEYNFAPNIHTRLLASDDAEACFRLVDENREFLRRWIPWIDECQSVEERGAVIDLTLNYPESGWCDAGIWVDDVLAGIVGLHSIHPPARSATIHYYLGERFEGRGLITRTVQAIVDEHFRLDVYNRLMISVVTENPRSLAIPTRLGFQHEGTLRQAYALYGRCYDLALFALLREDWERLSLTDLPLIFTTEDISK